ncbi:hypothetical protein J6590_103914 [Homalodisca vitripennis]|nr:hypothetical protein J6590_103914 [Homalodisca vitripennis]
MTQERNKLQTNFKYFAFTQWDGYHGEVESSGHTALVHAGLLRADVRRDVTSPESRDLPDRGGLLTVGLGHPRIPGSGLVRQADQRSPRPQLG